MDCVNKHITCKRDDMDPMKDLIGCRKPCRFGFPRPPMRETVILQPLAKDTEKTILAAAQKNYKKIQANLECKGRQFKENIPFDSYLGISYENYITAIP